MSAVVFLRDRFVDASDARISLFDRGYLVGDSIFTTMRAYAGAVFRLAEHMQRIERGAATLGLTLPTTASELAALVTETVQRVGTSAAVARLTISRGEGPLGVGSTGVGAPTVSIIGRPLTPYPAEAYRDGIPSTVLRLRRVPPECLDPSCKTGNYLPAVLSRRELEQKGMLEGVQLSVHGTVVCGTISNIFVVTGTALRTPDPSSGCLPGITRRAVLREAVATGIEVSEGTVTVADLESATEVFFTNTLMECLPVQSVDGRRFGTGPGPVTRDLHRALQARIRAETAKSP